MKSFLVLFAPFFLNYALAIANSARPSAGQGLDVHILPSHPHRSKSSKRQIVWRIQIMDRFDEHDKYHCIVGGDVAVRYFPFSSLPTAPLTNAVNLGAMRVRI
jgi:hypothetical protein